MQIFKFLNLKFVTLFLGLTLSFSHAQASILMLDLNFSSNEYLVVKKEAERRKVRLQVYPDISEDTRQKLKPLKNLINSTEKHYYELIGPVHSAEVLKHKQIENLSPADQAIAWNEFTQSPSYKTILNDLTAGKDVYDNYVKEASKLLPPTPRFTMQEIENFLINQMRLNDPVSSIVISGHHISGYHGIFGDHFYEKQLFDIFKRHPELKAYVKIAYLWGCYTIDDDDGLTWKETLPNVILAGWNNTAPRETATPDLAYLQTLLQNEDRLSAKQDVHESESVFHSISSIKVANPAMLVQNKIISLRGTREIDNAVCSDQLLDETSKALEEYRKYLGAYEAGYNDVPEDGGSSPLRRIYKKIHDAKHCEKAQDLDKRIEEIIRLIHFPYLKQNFAAYYAADIARVNDFLVKMNAPREALFPNLHDTTFNRWQVRVQLDNYSKFVWQLKWKAGNPANELIDLSHEMTKRAFKILDRCRCTGSMWIQSPNPWLETPDASCINDSNFN